MLVVVDRDVGGVQRGVAAGARGVLGALGMGGVEVAAQIDQVLGSGPLARLEGGERARERRRPEARSRAEPGEAIVSATLDRLGVGGGSRARCSSSPGSARPRHGSSLTSSGRRG
jgi:hypothetical protein